ARLSDITNTSLGNVVVTDPRVAPNTMLTSGDPLFNHPIALSPILDATTLQANLTVPLLDYVLRIPGLHAAAARARDAAKHSDDASRLQVAADARVAYYSWVRARLQTVVAEQALAQAKSHLESAEHLFQAGTANKADVLRTEALVASSELFVARAKDLEAVL